MTDSLRGRGARRPAEGTSRTGADTQRRRERGSAAVWVLLLVMVLTAATVIATGLADVSVTRHRAAAAADLAALAAARSPDPARPSGGPSGCAAAEQVAAGHDARLLACSIDGAGVVDVVAGVDLSPWVRHLAGRGTAGGGPIRASARASPGPLAGWPGTTG
jgi:secretion/DNA translocation related TadE-like protein